MNLKEIKKEISERILKIPLEQVLKDLSNTILNQEEVITELYIALATNSNIILYGDGGYGKSFICKTFCDYFKINTSIISGYKNMEPEKLIGIPNMNELLDNSNVVTEFSNSPFCKQEGVLILEEFLDCNPETAACLKDILTAGGMREKDKFYESKIASVIICSNKDPFEFCDRPEYEALYISRFPFRKEVKWDTYKEEYYSKLFSFKFKDVYKEKECEFDTLAKCCTEITASPRLAISAGKIVDRLGIEYIKYLPEFNGTETDSILKDVKINKAIIDENKLLTDISDKVLKDFKDPTIEVEVKKAIISLTIKNLDKMSLHDDNCSFRDELIDNLQDILNSTEVCPKISNKKLEDYEQLFNSK